MDKTYRNIETLYIPHNYFKQHRIRNGKEIIWQGKMYDIKWAKLKNDVMVVKAIYDAKEHTLISKYTKHVQKQHDKGMNSSYSLSKILKFEYLPHLFFQAKNSFTIIQNIPVEQERTCGGFLKGLFQPPQHL